MTQSNPILGSGLSGLSYRGADNDGKQALLNHHKGSAAPSYAEAGVIWIDDAATPWLMKVHDGAGWITLFSVDASDDSAVPALPPGAVVDRSIAVYTTHAGLAAAIPYDDTVPQNTEGTEILSASITPKSAGNLLRARFAGCGLASSGSVWAAALFRDSGAGALAAAVAGNGSTGVPSHLSFTHEFAAGGTAETTLKLRVGPDAGTLYMNGTAAARVFGGVMKAVLVIEEIQG